MAKDHSLVTAPGREKNLNGTAPLRSPFMRRCLCCRDDIFNVTSEQVQSQQQHRQNTPAAKIKELALGVKTFPLCVCTMAEDGSQSYAL